MITKVLMVQVKLSLCLTKYHAMKAYLLLHYAHAMKTYWGNGSIAPHIKLSTIWRWVVSFTSWLPIVPTGQEAEWAPEPVWTP